MQRRAREHPAHVARELVLDQAEGCRPPVPRPLPTPGLPTAGPGWRESGVRGPTARRSVPGMESLTFHDDPAVFLAEARDHLAREPVLSTIVATTTERAVADDAARLPTELPHRWWMVARDGAGSVSGVAMRTAPFAPYPPFLLPMPDEVARRLARTLHERGEHVGGVNGALPAAEICAAELARLGGGEVRVLEHTRLHRLDRVVAPAPAPGRLRPATVGEVELVVAWFEAFADAADEQAGRAPGSGRGFVVTPDELLGRIARDEVWWWVGEDGEATHLSALHAPSFGAARIAPVYTPPEHRGRGYAGNAVAALSQRILDAGAVPCLYTDRANPTSTRLYASLGYRPVADMVDLVVVGGAGRPRLGHDD